MHRNPVRPDDAVASDGSTPSPISPPSPDHASAPESEGVSDVERILDSVDTISENIGKSDPVASAVARYVESETRQGALEIPRLPHVAAQILECARDPNASAKDVIRHLRADPVLAGRLLEMANSAMYAGSQPVYDLGTAIVRLGLSRVGETALGMSGAMKAFQKERRSNLLSRLWKFSLATGFASEQLAHHVPGEKEESGFLTGIFHAIAAPVIVNAIGRLERKQKIPHQSDGRVLGLLDRLSTELTGRIVRPWKLPKEAVEAIRLQDGKVRERRGKPLAHILVCGKAIVADLGIGTRPTPIDFDRCRDFKFIEMNDHGLLGPIREVVRDRTVEIARS